MSTPVNGSRKLRVKFRRCRKATISPIETPPFWLIDIFKAVQNNKLWVDKVVDVHFHPVFNLFFRLHAGRALNGCRGVSSRKPLATDAAIAKKLWFGSLYLHQCAADEA